MDVLSIIANYWLTWLLGLIAAGLGVVAKKFYSLYQKEKVHQKTEEQKQFYDSLKSAIQEATSLSRKEEQKLQDEIDILKEGLLSLQGRAFKQQCRDYLQADKEFTLAEFEELQDEHDTYNHLGGNHDGDTLFDLVAKKANKILTDDK